MNKIAAKRGACVQNEGGKDMSNVQQGYGWRPCCAWARGTSHGTRSMPKPLFECDDSFVWYVCACGLSISNNNNSGRRRYACWCVTLVSRWSDNDDQATMQNGFFFGRAAGGTGRDGTMTACLEDRQ